MRWYLGVTWAAAVVPGIGLPMHPSNEPSLIQPPAHRVQAADSQVYHDAETGFTFSQYAAEYQIGSSITYRITLPQPVNSSNYDVVIQIVAPRDVGWAGLSWGGQMPYCPLTVAWSNGNNVLISSRYATGHVAPNLYNGAQYTVFKTGTHVNNTHWQFTAKCSGCSYFTGGDTASTRTQLTPTGSNHLAFAASTNKLPNPSSNTTSLNVHDVYNYWNHDFSVAGNAQFASLVTKDVGK